MTKEELKNALISHGAPVPPASAKKDEFIQAYEEHVAPLDAGGEFSSDEEGPKTPSKRASNASKGKQSTSSRKSQGSPRKTPSKVLEESADIEMNVDIGSLDDDQLFEMLKKNGVEVGPIVASTRKFYEKKLSAALAGTNNGTNGTKEFSDTEPEEDEEEEEQPAVVEVVAKKRTPRSVKSSSSPLVESGLRQRLALADELDSSPASPGARRAIHSYKVTETTRQVTTRSKDGTETVDTKHSVERSESQGVSPKDSRSLFSRLAYPLLKLAIFLTLLIGVYLVFTTPSDGVTPIDKVADIINNAMPPAAEEIKAEVPEEMKKAVEEAAAAPPPPPPAATPAPPAPDASNVVDV